MEHRHGGAGVREAKGESVRREVPKFNDNYVERGGVHVRLELSATNPM